MEQLQLMSEQVETVLRELCAAAKLEKGSLIVFGVSTSEVIGSRIGTAGTEQVAEALYRGIRKAAEEIGFSAAYQCCEHLNRALVIERSLLDRLNAEQVAAVPVAKAGGAMAAYAYRQLERPCLIETIQADAGIDIGETLIGMHLKRVAVPFRPSIRSIGQARVTAAYARPKLIGGLRAVYTLEEAAQQTDRSRGSEDC